MAGTERVGDGDAQESVKGNNSSHRKQRRLPPSFNAEKPSTIVSISHDDDQNTVTSGLTTSTAYHFRSPPSRIKLSKAEIDEDLELEVAFIDAEIYHAKKRQSHHKSTIQGQGKQRSASPAPIQHTRSASPLARNASPGPTLKLGSMPPPGPSQGSVSGGLGHPPRSSSAQRERHPPKVKVSHV